MRDPQVPGLPSITLFLFFGLLCGPFGISLISRSEMQLLKWINDVALGFIGLSAGGHFQVSEMAGNLRPVLIVLTSLVVITYSGMMTCMLLFGNYFIPFFEHLRPSQRISASALIACLSVARSVAPVVRVALASAQHVSACRACLRSTRHPSTGHLLRPLPSSQS